MNGLPTKVIDPTRLSAEDAYTRSPPTPSYTSELSDGNGGDMHHHSRRLKAHHRHRPDNYTDEETFLDNLKLNPRMQRYEFWPLVSDSQVIVQQVCAVIIFVCCFSGIIQARVSPVTVVTTGTFLTVVGWFLWDYWCGKEEALRPKGQETAKTEDIHVKKTAEDGDGSAVGLGLNMAHESSASVTTQEHSRNASTTSVKQSGTGQDCESLATASAEPSKVQSIAPGTHFSLDTATSQWSVRNQQRIATLKSALLIYCALLGLSPILKSLTKSTASDSIWAISFWLMSINVFFFDYGGGVGDIFPASLSTNAALMASTVLASRLPSTSHVFSLTLFSIEVFGLFPVFRRYLRHVSGRAHKWLTWSLVMGAGGGTVSMFTNGGWAPAILGAVLGLLVTGIAMGVLSYWLISLQVYKNEIHGPWDPARPIIRRRWD
ncbi:MAG: hypothetical protein Q9159_006437 [Coniocarpon cinnabarinum]